MFRFNFLSDNEENKEEATKEEAIDAPEDLKKSKKLEVTQDQYAEIAETLKNSKLNVFISNELEIGYLDNTSITDHSDTDLIPRVYEGGFKIWECTQDLADVLTSADNDRVDFTGMTVCDLGCSAGVLGIIALINGAQKVDFQDYVRFF